jgi:hypothetical protein
MYSKKLKPDKNTVQTYETWCLSPRPAELQKYAS